MKIAILSYLAVGLFALQVAALAQKAEPNPQNPAVPQANSGAPESATPSTAASPQPQDNAVLQGHIQQALLNEPGLNSSRISVEVTDTDIALAGSVASSKEKETADRIARSFDGNRQFTNKIVVTGAGQSGGGSLSGSTHQQH